MSSNFISQTKSFALPQQFRFVDNMIEISYDLILYSTKDKCQECLIIINAITIQIDRCIF